VTGLVFSLVIGLRWHASLWQPRPAPAASSAEAVEPDSPAYLAYTSGSTGEPKGAINRHRDVVNRLRWMRERFGLDGSERGLHKTSIAFDVAIAEILEPLIAGGQLVIAPPGTDRDPVALAGLVRDAAVTALQFVPSMLESFLRAVEHTPVPSLRRIVCAGEALSHALQERCFEVLPGVRLLNLYGPVEAAIEATWWDCAEQRDRDPVPIGRPISSMRVHVLDRHDQLMPVGVPGEIHLAGVGVAAGYHDRDALTRERFIPEPVTGHPNPHAYRTGDMGRWTEGGVLEFLGRRDQQLKVRGVRVELGEVETSSPRGSSRPSCAGTSPSGCPPP